MIRFSLILLLGFYQYFLQAQVRLTPPILKKIASINGSIQIQNKFVDNWIKVENLPISFNNSVQKIIKTKKGIFLNIDGTGRLYQFVVKNDSCHFIRIDSTYFTGYNFGSIFFDYDDIIYSFGGEGFWSTNGDLRLFDKYISHEWHAQKLNKIIHGSFSDNMGLEGQFYFYNQKNHTLIISSPINSQSHILENNNEINDFSNKQKLFQLDILKGKWSEFGFQNFKKSQRIAFTSHGIIYDDFIVDFDKNKVYKFKNNFLGKIFQRSAGDNKVSITFCKDSILYYGNSTGLIDSVYIGYSNLIDTGKPAYLPIENQKSFLSVQTLLGLAFVSTILIALYLLYKKKIYKLLSKTDKEKSIEIPDAIVNETYSTISQEMDKTTLFRSGKLIELLSDHEIDFLKYVYNHSFDERLTTIEEINKKLGTSNKTIEIQKKMRSDMINGINNKLSIFNKNTRPVIDKQRSEFDKRSFEYFIHPDHMGLTESIIKVNKG